MSSPQRKKSRNKKNPEEAAQNRIGILGGTFDPVHTGHVQLAEFACQKLSLNKILFIPTAIHPFTKHPNISSATQRREMLELATQHYPKFEISLFELQRSATSYTFDTLLELQKINQEVELYFFIGDDNLKEFHLWKEYRKILDMVQVVVFRRARKQRTKIHPQMIYLNNPLITISSTLVRESIKKGLPVNELIPAEVVEYIRDNRLYID